MDMIKEIPNNEYRDKLIEAVNCLNQMQFDLFTPLVNIAMFGEFSQINEMFDTGDSVNFDDEMFKNCKDQNVQLLHKLLKEIKSTTESITNINAIQLSELNEEI
jgi:hypothetical protein